MTVGGEKHSYLCFDLLATEPKLIATGSTEASRRTDDAQNTEVGAEGVGRRRSETTVPRAALSLTIVRIALDFTVPRATTIYPMVL